MTADIDRQKLRELCERATPGPWVRCHHLQSPEKDASCPCGYRGGIWGADGEHIILEMGSQPTPGQEGLEPPRYPRHVELANAAFIAAVRTALPALLDLTDAQAAENEKLKTFARDTQVICDAQAAKIAELEAENVRLDENLSGFLDENRALHDDAEALCDRIASLESERDQLRKQVEGQFVAGMQKAAEIAKNIRGAASFGSEYYCAVASVQNHILSAASALEQEKEQR